MPLYSQSSACGLHYRSTARHQPAACTGGLQPAISLQSAFPLYSQPSARSVHCCSAASHQTAACTKLKLKTFTAIQKQLQIIKKV